MKGHISAAFIDEVAAVASAAGIPFRGIVAPREGSLCFMCFSDPLSSPLPPHTYAELMQLQMVPELLKAHCTMVGAWGQATAVSALQLSVVCECARVRLTLTARDVAGRQAGAVARAGLG